MLKAILADHNLAGHLRALHRRVWLSPEWIEIWQSLAIRIETLETLGLDPKTPDDVIWRLCQDMGWILFTANRNRDGDASLNATMQRENTLDSFPIVTVSDADRIWNDSNFAREVADKTLEICMDIHKYLGAGRLFVPK
jgi:hypothetical protein